MSTYYWGPNGYLYYDPLLLKAECGEKASRESAIAALIALSREVDVGMGTIILGILFAGFFAAVGVLLFFAMGGGGGFTRLFPTLVPLLFVIFGLGIGGYIVVMAARLKSASRALRGLARMVDMGLVGPGEVCGKTALTLVELYKIKSVGVQPAGGLGAL